MKNRCSGIRRVFLIQMNRQIFFCFLKAGFTAFGASAVEIFIEELVEKKQWLRIQKFESLMALAGLAPGPYHVNLSISLGYEMAGIRGSIAAAAGFLIPSVSLAIMASVFIETEMVFLFLQKNKGITAGMSAAIGGVLISVIHRLVSAENNKKMYLVLSFLFSGFIIYFKISFVFIIVGGGLLYMIFTFLNQKTL